MLCCVARARLHACMHATACARVWSEAAQAGTRARHARVRRRRRSCTARICQSGRRPVRGQVSNSQQYALLPASSRKIAVNVRRGGPAASRPAVRVSVQCSAVRSRGAVGDARMVHRSSIVPFGCQKSSNRVSFSPHSDAGHVGLGVPNDGELWW